MNDFFRNVFALYEKNSSCLCIGLDPEPSKIPSSVANSKTPIYDFLARIVDRTYDLVCAYKPNMAFFEAFGLEGQAQLLSVIEHIKQTDVPIILDGKRGDIGNTARMYASAMFDRFGAQAVTINPYLGMDSVEPFIERKDKGIFILCLTSNPGYADFEAMEFDGEPLFVKVAKKSNLSNVNGNIGLVVGATHPEEAERIRAVASEIPFLMPGIGAQGGDPSKIMKIGFTKSGFPPIVNSSRGIIYAGSGVDFADIARESAIKTKDILNENIK